MTQAVAQQFFVVVRDNNTDSVAFSDADQAHHFVRQNRGWRHVGGSTRHVTRVAFWDKKSQTLQN